MFTGFNKQFENSSYIFNNGLRTGKPLLHGFWSKGNRRTEPKRKKKGNYFLLIIYLVLGIYILLCNLFTLASDPQLRADVAH